MLGGCVSGWVGRSGRRGCVLRCEVAHGESENDVEEETEDIRAQHGKEDGPWCFDFWFVDSVASQQCRFSKVEGNLTPP